MKVDVNWLNKESHLEATNEHGGIIRIDGDSTIGGMEGGLSPLQLLLAGIGSCSALDVISILKKQKQNLTGISVEVDGDKQKTDIGYKEFKTIHLHFVLTGEVDPKKVQRALDLSITKYCSVSKALEKGSEISYDFEIVNA